MAEIWAVLLYHRAAGRSNAEDFASEESAGVTSCELGSAGGSSNARDAAKFHHLWTDLEPDTGLHCESDAAVNDPARSSHCLRGASLPYLCPCPCRGPGLDPYLCPCPYRGPDRGPDHGLCLGRDLGHGLSVGSGQALAIC